jgi:phosphoribosylformylglycinamidine synthase
METKVRILVRLKDGVLDPQGRAVLDALKALGFKNVTDARIGKLIEIKIKNNSKKLLKAEIEKMCKKLLVNPVIENFEFEIEDKKI